MILCGFCGYQNKNQSKFCSSCGNRLAEESYLVGRVLVLSESGSRREYLISEADRYLGRDAANDVVLEDEEVSARHARISFADGGFWVEDLQTTNGTFVNGERLRERTRLQNEDLVKIGRTLLQFRV
jgi:pSer/pThr/pTyr-binding forkhead associated (FHA) protein